MKFIYQKVFMALTLCVFCPAVFAQTPQAVQLADSLIHAGSFKAAVTTYDFPDNIKLLQNKALESLKSDPRWANRYAVTQVQKGYVYLEYMDAYGLSKEEFGKMLAGFKAERIPIYGDTSQITIKKEGGLFTFQCPKQIALLNYLRIDVDAGVIFLDNLKLTKELPVYAKSYAPILKGFECNGTEVVSSRKKQSSKDFYGVSIGRNTKDLKTTLCLVSGDRPNPNEIVAPEFLIITLWE